MIMPGQPAGGIPMMKPRFLCLAVTLVLLAGCTRTYESRQIPFRPPEAYPNRQLIEGFSVAVEAYGDKKTAGEAFGFDIRGAGLLPVQLIMNNGSGRQIEIVKGQTFLVDGTGAYWQVLSNVEAVERLRAETEAGRIVKGAGRGSMWGAAGGAILGAALGIVSGRNVLTSAANGAVVGGAGGAIMGGAHGAEDRRGEYALVDDIARKGLEGKQIPDQSIASGFIFFPGEAPSVKELRLQYREKETGRIHTVVFPLK